MKRSDLFFAALLVPIDFCMILAAGLAAYFLRFQIITEIRPVIFEIPLWKYIQYEIGVALFFLVVFSFSGLYAIGHQHVRNEFQKVATACSAGIMLIIIFIFLIQELFTSRFIVLAAWVISIFFVMFGRLSLRVLRYAFFKRGINLHSVALLGTEDQIQKFIRDIGENSSVGFKIVYTAQMFTDEVRKNLEHLREKKQLDELILLDATIPHDEFKHVLEFTDLQHIGFRYSADVIGSRKLEISPLGSFPMVEIRRTKLEGWWKIIKRLFDSIVSGILILFLSPLFLLITIFIKLTSKGPVIYRNTRVGPNGTFDTYKFRSMFIEHCTGERYDKTGTAEQFENSLVKERSERTGPVFKILNDPRRTRIGRIFEKTSLDELPQLFNVLEGSMSLVGPRPHMPKEVAGYEKHHHQLFSVKPGITGLAQISGRSDLDFGDEAKIDLYYIQNWSLLLDFIILLKTPWAVISRRSRV
ncbi:MAG: sugar transferase [bacterium]|nr:sugar transferase [bacterium]